MSERERCERLVAEAIREQVQRVHERYDGIDLGGAVVTLMVLEDQIKGGYEA